MLGSKEIAFDERQYFKQKPTVDEVKAIAALLPGGVRDMVSRRSRRFRELAPNLEALSDEELVALLAEEPGLWRRPIVVTDQGAVIGFDQKRLEELLG